MKSRYFTHAHNINDCLRNGSYVRQDGRHFTQFMNGDCMGEVDKVPASMTEVEAKKAEG
jgi:hypothetical protein